MNPGQKKDGRTDGQPDSSIPPPKLCFGGYKKYYSCYLIHNYILFIHKIHQFFFKRLDLNMYAISNFVIILIICPRI